MALRFGAFLLPEHDPRENPTTALRDDLDLVVHLDRLGVHEVWIGEHHSGGWSPLSSPELFLSAAAERTSQIMLGTGVISLPYHHPLMTVNRMVQLDHQTRGRVMMGMGAGISKHDARMMGIPPERQRARMAESLDAVLRLLHGTEPVTMRTEWFELVEATLQLRPYSRPVFELATASAGSDRGMRLAARHGLSALSFAGRPGLTDPPLSAMWDAAEDEAGRSGRTVDRSRWRVAVCLHLAETREAAIRQASEGMSRWYQDYVVDALGMESTLPAGRELEASVEAGKVIVGSVDDAIEGIERLLKDGGGFGTLLSITHAWAGREDTLRSYDLLARYVMPHFSGATSPLRDSLERVRATRIRSLEEAAGTASVR